MKLGKITLCLGLSMAMCVPSAFAVTTHAHQPQPLPDSIAVSDWAEDEVARAMELGLGPSAEEYGYLPGILSAPAQREWLCIYSSRLIAFQQGCDEPSLTDMVLYYEAEKDALGQPKSAFADMPGVGYATALYYLGVANGRGDGKLDPNGQLTRQEAATFLARVYKAYGGSLSEGADAPSFSDAGQIADWAKDSVEAMSAVGIMKGYEDGRFAPNDLYSHEQCLLTLLRLYENLPVSRKNGNVKSLYTYDQCMAYVSGKDQQASQQGGGTYAEGQVDGPVATFVQQINAGGMGSMPQFKFVYQDGGMKSILDFGVCDTGWGWMSSNTNLVNPHFSEDGKTFYCTVTLKEEVQNPNTSGLSSVAHSHDAGTYEITINIETLNAKAIKI